MSAASTPQDNHCARDAPQATVAAGGETTPAQDTAGSSDGIDAAGTIRDAAFGTNGQPVDDGTDLAPGFDQGTLAVPPLLPPASDGATQKNGQAVEDTAVALAGLKRTAPPSTAAEGTSPTTTINNNDAHVSGDCSSPPHPPLSPPEKKQKTASPLNGESPDPTHKSTVTATTDPSSSPSATQPSDPSDLAAENTAEPESAEEQVAGNGETSITQQHTTGGVTSYSRANLEKDVVTMQELLQKTTAALKKLTAQVKVKDARIRELERLERLEPRLRQLERTEREHRSVSKLIGPLNSEIRRLKMEQTKLKKSKCKQCGKKWSNEPPGTDGSGNSHGGETPVLARHERNYQRHYRQLVEHQKRHGTVEVRARGPNSNSGLADWVREIRKEYAAMAATPVGPTPTPAPLLPVPPTVLHQQQQTPAGQTTFAATFEPGAVDPAATMGDPSVVGTVNEKPAGGTNDGRAVTKRAKTRQTKLLTAERMAQLMQIPGFTWKMPRAKPPTFEERVQQLIAYQEQHGDMNVPQLDRPGIPPGLGHFVRTSRYMYKLHVQGKKGKYVMGGDGAKARIDRLREIGFNFSVRNRGGWGSVGHPRENHQPLVPAEATAAAFPNPSPPPLGAVDAADVDHNDHSHHHPNQDQHHYPLPSTIEDPHHHPPIAEDVVLEDDVVAAAAAAVAIATDVPVDLDAHELLL